jgi:hypothetical protein
MLDSLSAAELMQHQAAATGPKPLERINLDGRSLTEPGKDAC